MAKISRSLRFRLLAEAGFRCQYCGAAAENGAALEVDHVHPLSKGGSNRRHNLKVACFDCNRGKRAELLPIFQVNQLGDLDCCCDCCPSCFDVTGRLSPAIRPTHVLEQGKNRVSLAYRCMYGHSWHCGWDLKAAQIHSASCRLEPDHVWPTVLSVRPN